MPKKRLVVTSRGQRLDMDALKASQPNVRPLLINKEKDKPNFAQKTTNNAINMPRPARIHATSPAPLPKPTDVPVKQVVAAPVPAVEIKPLPAKVVHVGQTVVDEVEHYADEPTVIKGKNKKD